MLQQYEKQGSDFLHRIVTGDKSWIRHYDFEQKIQGNLFSKWRWGQIRSEEIVSRIAKCLVDGFEKLVSRWHKCVERKDKRFEK